jgi:hypothetical protein
MTPTARRVPSRVEVGMAFDEAVDWLITQR